MLEKNILIEVFQKLDNESLLEVILSCKYFYSLIDVRFWSNRLEMRFPWFFRAGKEEEGFNAKQCYISLYESIDAMRCVDEETIENEWEIDLMSEDWKIWSLVDASMAGCLPMVRYLIEKSGINPSTLDNVSIKRAARMGHLSIVKYLVEKAKVDTSTDNYMPLRLACEWGQLEVVRYLVEKCKNPPHVLEEMCLRVAAEKGHLSVVKYLIEERNCDPNNNNDYPLTAAKREGRKKVVKYLSSLSCDKK